MQSKRKKITQGKGSKMMAGGGSYTPEEKVRILRRRVALVMIIIATYMALVIFFSAKYDSDDFEDEFLNAVYGGDIKKVEEMLKSGENPNKRDSYGNNPLTLAGYAKQAAIAEVLISHGADLSITDDSGMTPLHCAAYKGNVAVAKVLLAHGAPIDPIDNYGYTPLPSAVAGGSQAMVEILLERGADVHHKDAAGWQPLHTILRVHELEPEVRYEIVAILLEHGADPNAKNPGGWEKDSEHDSRPTPFALFQRENPNRGNTPLAIAESNGFNDIVDLLRKHGAKKEAFEPGDER